MEKLYRNSKGRLFEDYREYLESSHWDNIRLARLKKDGYQCQICGSGKNLCVHHLTYDRIGREQMDDLITLCQECHEKVHAIDIERKKQKKDNPGIRKWKQGKARRRKKAAKKNKKVVQ